MIIWIVCYSEVLSLEPQYWLIFTNSYGNDSWTEQLLNYPGCQGIFYLYEWFSTWTAKNEPEEADQDSEFASPLRLALPFSSGTPSIKVNQITLRINAKFEYLVYSGCYVAYKLVLCHESQNYIQSNLSLWRSIVVIYTWVRDVSHGQLENQLSHGWWCWWFLKHYDSDNRGRCFCCCCCYCLFVRSFVCLFVSKWIQRIYPKQLVSDFNINYLSCTANQNCNL